MPDCSSLSNRTCNFCSGKGRVAESGFDGDDIECPVCRGSREVLVDNRAAPHLICDGSGKIKMRGPFGKQVAICPDCQGTGWAC